MKKLPEQPSFKNLLGRSNILLHYAIIYRFEGKPLVELNPGPDVVTDAEIAGKSVNLYECYFY